MPHERAAKRRGNSLSSGKYGRNTAAAGVLGCVIKNEYPDNQDAGQDLVSPIRLLTFSTLYPNNVQRSHGIFVENRLTELVAGGQAVSMVVAPVPYVPSSTLLPKRYRTLSGVAPVEQRHGLTLHHPRYLLIPKISMEIAPLSLYLAGKRSISAILAAGYDFDVIDAHYFYPDGVAAILLGRHFRKPVTITARGSDITELPDYALPRRMIQWAANRADGIITVCAALKDGLVDLGARADKIRVLRNGVDLKKFFPVDRDRARTAFNLSGTVLISVGHLIPRKGHDLAIEALAALQEATLLIVGDGPERANLEAIAKRLGVLERIRFLGQLPHEALPEVYAAADVLLLLSTREGWANVLLEAMACGTPVVATEVGGTSEVVTSSAVGELVRERSAGSVANAVKTLLDRTPGREAVRTYAEGFSWDATTTGQIELFEEILLRRQPSVMRAHPVETLEPHVL